MISSMKIALTVIIAITVITGFGNAKKVPKKVDAADAKNPDEQYEPKRDDLCTRDILLTGFYADNVELNCVFVHMLPLPMQNITTNESYGYRYGRDISSNLSKKICAFPRDKWCVMNVPRKEFNECLGLRRPNGINASTDSDGEDDNYENFHDDGYNEPPRQQQQKGSDDYVSDEDDDEPPELRQRTGFNDGSDDYGFDGDDDDGFHGKDDSKYFEKLYQEYFSSFDDNIEMSKNNMVKKIKRKDFLPNKWCAAECIRELKQAKFNVEEKIAVENKTLMAKKFKDQRPSNFVNTGMIQQARNALSNQSMGTRPYRKYGYVDRFGVKLLTLSKMDPQENGIEWCKKSANHILKDMNVPKYGRINDRSPDIDTNQDPLDADDYNNNGYENEPYDDPEE